MTYNEKITANNTKLDALKTEVEALPDYIAPKPEQTKDYTITANGDTPITPDPGKVITGGMIKVNVPTGGSAETVEVTLNDQNDYGCKYLNASGELVTVPAYRPERVNIVKNSCIVLSQTLNSNSYTRIVPMENAEILYAIWSTLYIARTILVKGPCEITLYGGN